ncbi:ATP-grasp domain-containing protein [Lederbergia citrea]|uniref:ATP-grasp domain-containing protein n=1 Tax=Lederbergia citrea TaxID=2833581 RepID=UPI001BC908E3|nr:ATP-grasp domain-containing protein [Lederbergia citrea]MBS4176695.1 ATP-grasp domain-containing protein [Lederbergia citrea]MBS4203256.1 ATP-grasp domain-containing protein [Lederbergia citrea]
MQSIVFLGSNKSGTSRDAIKAAEDLGYFTVLITNKDRFMKQRDEFHDVKKMIYVESIDRSHCKEQITILQQQGIDICACISFVDPYVHLAAMLSKEIGLFQSSTDALFKMEEKTRIREALKNLSVTPFYTLFHPNELVDSFVEQYKNQLPLILKPPASNGSKDIFLVETKSDFRQGLKQLKKKHPNMPVLVEEYLNGPQYLIEVVAYNNQLNIIGVIEQEISNDNRFIVMGYKYPAALVHEEYEILEEAITTILNSLDLRDGSCHLEMRNIKGKWKLIEINPRMSGGAMNRILYEGTGINLAKEIIKLYLGEIPSFITSRNTHVYARFLTVSSAGRLLKVTGENRAANYEGVKDVYVKPHCGSLLTEPYSLGNRYAYVIASSDTQEEAERIALNAAKEIKFYIEPY